MRRVRQHRRTEFAASTDLLTNCRRVFSSSPGDRSILFAALEDDSSDDDAVDNSSDVKASDSSSSSNGHKDEIGLTVKLDVEPKHMFDTSKMSPMWHLKHYYKMQRGIVISTEEHFSTEMVQYRQRESESTRYCWKAAFFSPCVGYKFQSGTFRDDPTKQPLQHKNLPKRSVVYTKRSIAENAAAARALDYIQYTITGATEPRLCEEHPSEVFKCQDHTGLVHVYYRRRNVAGILTRPTVKKLKTRQVDNAVLYSASFMCPISGTQYDSTMVDAVTSPAGDERPGFMINGRYYYPSQRQAKRAAYRRCLDVNFNVDTEDEASSSTAVDFGLPAVEDSKELAPHHLDVSSPSIVQYDDDPYMSEASSESSGDEDEDASSTTDVPILDAEGEVYEVNYPVTASIASPAQQFLTDVKDAWSSRPMDLDAALDMAACAGRPGGAKYGYGSPHRLKLHPKDSPGFFWRGKAALKMLSGAVQTTPHTGGSKANVAAAHILQRMWFSKDSKPDTDCYTMYLKCFDQSDQHRIVKIAESLVSSMQLRSRYRKTGHRLPRPDQSTLNTLIQLTAQLGGTAGRFASHINDESFVPDRNSFLSVLSSAIYDASEDGDTAGFDPEFAADCIQRMQELSEELNDETLLPDVQVYNAPLRWTGGPVLWAQSRPYARYVDWDDYEYLYRRGFRETSPADDLTLKQARMIQEWLERMEQLGVEDIRLQPNIETYEAVIQAWLRTATREGLEKAEAMVHKLFESSNTIEPRLQTMHPILAARLYFIEQDSHSKILEILDLWSSFSKEKGMQPDMRLVELELRILQALHGHATNDGNDRFELHTSYSPRQKSPEDIKNDVLAAAMKCSAIVADVQKNDAIMCKREMLLLKSNVRAWMLVVKLGDGKLSTEAVQEVERTIARIYDILDSSLRRDWTKGGPFMPRLAKNAPPELEHCLHQCHVVFFSCIVLLEEACKQQPHDIDLLRASLLHGEKMLRIVGEIEIIERTELEEHGGDPWQTSFDSDDRFEYKLYPKFLVTMTREQAMRPLMRFLGERATDLADEELVCDAVRIFSLWKSIWPSNPRTKEFQAIIMQLAPAWLTQIVMDDGELEDEVTPEVQSAQVDSSNESAARKRRRRGQQRKSTRK